MVDLPPTDAYFPFYVVEVPGNGTGFALAYSLEEAQTLHDDIWKGLTAPMDSLLTFSVYRASDGSVDVSNVIPVALGWTKRPRKPSRELEKP